MTLQALAKRRGTTTPATYKLEVMGITYSPNLTYEVWAESLSELGDMGLRAQWGMGDAIIEAEHRWGEIYAQAIQATKYSEGTLRNRVSICRAFPRERRKWVLSQSHYAAVLCLRARPDLQNELLALAERQELDRETLRDLAKASKRLHIDPPDDTVDDTIEDDVEDIPAVVFDPEALHKLGTSAVKLCRCLDRLLVPPDVRALIEEVVSAATVAGLIDQENEGA